MARRRAPPLLFVFFCVAAVVAAAIWLAGWPPTRDGYIASQLPLFHQINQARLLGSMTWRNVTELGDALVLLALFSPLILARPRVWAALISAAPVSLVLSHGLKALFAMPRPAAILDAHELVVLGKILGSADSLPSGHAVTIATAGTVILLCWRELGLPRSRLTPAAIVGATLVVALSRVVVGAHWPVDIVAGAAVGVAGGWSGVILARALSGPWAWLLDAHRVLSWGPVFLLWAYALLEFSIGHPHFDLIVYRVAAACVAITGGYLMVASANGHAVLHVVDRSALQVVAPAHAGSGSQ